MDYETMERDVQHELDIIIKAVKQCINADRDISNANAFKHFKRITLCRHHGFPDKTVYRLFIMYYS